MRPLCPSCGSPFVKFPARKTKCKSCGLYAYPRSTPQDSQKVLVTELRAKEIEDLWDAAWVRKSEEAAFNDLFNEIGAPKGTRAERLAAAIRLYDLERDPQKRRLIASTIAIALHGANKDPRDWLRRHAADRLAQWDTPNSLFRRFLKLGAWGCCANCQVIDGKKFDLDGARASKLLPQPGCTHRVNDGGFASCVCDWEIDMESLRAAR